MMRVKQVWFVGLLLPGALWLLPALAAPPAAADSAGIEFFEKKVRPILAENCYQCHGGKRQQSGLRLDNVAAVFKGGERGPAIVPGEPEKSVLIQAIRYGDENLQMPPKTRLKEHQIADLAAWVKMGAPAPKELASPSGAPQPKKDFDLAERRQHWAYEPVRPVRTPVVRNGSWPTSPIDSFILAKLEAAGLAPAPDADKRTLIRRLTFDLIGSPPTPAEVEAFVADEAPDAFARLVERLLASPHHGERWGRHWLDLVRYAETLGHEFDYELFNAWRYRDYVIRAFNGDLPYDQLVHEHIAGDLLPQPRRHPVEGYNESVIGTGFFWLGEGKHSPVDLRQEQADRIDNQIDVLGKTFLAQTIACARCHDHKFDAITTQDYYSLFGYLKSSRYQQAFLDPPERIGEKLGRLAATRKRIESTILSSLREQVESLDQYLLAARKVRQSKTPRGDAIKDIAREFGLDAGRLERWLEALEEKELGNPQHPLYAWKHLAQGGDESPFQEFRARRDSLLQVFLERRAAFDKAAAGSRTLADFSRQTYAGWFVTGDAFGKQPSRPGDLVIRREGEKTVVRLAPAGWAHSGLSSERLEGVLRSPTFTIEKRYIHFLSAGRGGRLNLVLDGFVMIRDPIYGGLTIEVNDDKPAWRTMDAGMWVGRRAYIEIGDNSTPNLAQPAKETAGPVGSGYVAVQQIHFADQQVLAPVDSLRSVVEVLADSSSGRSPERFARSYCGTLKEVLTSWNTQQPSLDYPEFVTLVNWLLDHGLVNADAPAHMLDDYHRTEESLPTPIRALALTDGTGEDELVFSRGNYRNLGERAPRRLPEVIGGPEQAEPRAGSGRLELARRLTSPSNPLLARVLVNRLWKHHFGAGIVRTPDDFGRMGEPPTHPELLDYLAGEFVRNGWSIKHMHRLMLLSSTYRMAGVSDPETDRRDPENKLLHKMPLRRLEAEAIRDAALAVAGQLRRQMFGPSVPPHLTPFMEGRGRPSESGPLDGAGRRSIYLGVRRNFLNPMFLAFDYPIPFTTMGRRNVSNVPAQALTMMNEPFIVQQARHWAERVLALTDRTTPERITDLYLTAFARPPTPTELEQATAFLGEQGRRHGGGPGDPRAWTDLCHVLMNVKEFIFLN